MRDHLPEYLAEAFGTAIMMLVGTLAIALMWAESSPMPGLLPSMDLRRLLTGLMFAGGATLVVVSPLGQRSGGHLNPAVTFAFWLQGRMVSRDAWLYAAAQILGALGGVSLAFRLAGTAVRSVRFGMTAPGDGFPVAAAFAAEAGITFLLVGLILFCVSRASFAPYTPILAGLLVAAIVFVEAPVSGASLNPARSLGPAVLAMVFADQWLYVVAPLSGAALAVLLHRWIAISPVQGCAKLRHREQYRCIFNDCAYRRFSEGEMVLREGEPADRAYLIERGEVEVRHRGEDGVERTLSRLGPGAWVGEMALLLDLPRSATVVASRDSELRPVTRENFSHVIAEHPNQTLALLRQLASRLREADRRLAGRAPD